MKIKEIRVSKSGVIPIASYSNLRPGFEIVAEVGEDEDLEKCKLTLKKLTPIFEGLQNVIDEQFAREENKALIKLIEKQYKNIGFHKKNGRSYPRTSSILDWDTEWKIPSYELNQHGARGRIIHRLSELFLKEEKWFNPTDLTELEDDVNILLSGNLKLHWEDCTHQKFMQMYGKFIGEPEAIEEVVFNEELFYSGTPDLIAPFKDLKSVIDYKTGGYDFAQLAAYAGCIEGIKQLVIFPLGPTNNVSGYSKPIVRLNWGDDWKRFLVMRKKFRENFGI